MATSVRQPARGSRMEQFRTNARLEWQRMRQNPDEAVHRIAIERML